MDDLRDQTPPAGATGSDADRGRISEKLHALLARRPDGDLKIRDLFDALSGRGHAALMVVLAMPMCLPIPIPGLAVVIGIILAFVGVRFSFRRRPWLPTWIMNRPFRTASVRLLAEKCAAVERRTTRLLRPRLPYMCRNIWMHRMHGVVVTLLALMLPLPIPFTNAVAGLPILILGLALIEDDGFLIIVGYIVAVISLAIFGAAGWYGAAGVGKLFHWFGAG